MLRAGFNDAGTMASAHLAALRLLPDVRIAAFADPVIERAQERAAQSGGVGVAGVDALWEHVDVVWVCSPPHLHAEHAIAAARSGRHVLLEKPMCLTLTECDEVIAACREHRVQLMVGQTQRFIGSDIAAKEAVRQGKIGRPVFVTDISVHPDFDPRGWFWTRAISGGGIFMSSAVHRADWLRWVMDAEFEEIHARVGTFGRLVETEDAGVVNIQFAGGALGSFVQIAPPGPTHAARRERVVYGTEGTIVVRMYEALELYSRRETLTLQFARDDCWVREMGEFVAAIREDRPPAVTGEDGKAAVAFVLAIYRSATLGRPVRLADLLADRI